MDTAMTKSVHIPRTILLGGLVLVAASAAVLPGVTGYGTELSQFVVLGAWSLVAAVTSSVFADLHREFVWPVAALVNVVLFGVPALVVF